MTLPMYLFVTSKFLSFPGGILQLCLLKVTVVLNATLGDHKVQ